jgi:response regulator RpfG family c-di-GMP phosphodiesterase
MLVDDDRNVITSLARLCRERLNAAFGPLRISGFLSPYGALEFARHRRIDTVIADYRMPEMNGAMLLAHLRALQPRAGRIMLSACVDRDGLIHAVNDAAIFRVLTKPWNPRDVELAVADALTEARRAAEDHRLADQMRAQQGALSAEEVALRALEAESPGITHVERSEDGGVLLVS